MNDYDILYKLVAILLVILLIIGAWCTFGYKTVTIYSLQGDVVAKYRGFVTITEEGSGVTVYHDFTEHKYSGCYVIVDYLGRE